MTGQPAPWYVYIVQCRDGTLYTGITTDVTRRVAEHNHGALGARYTRARRPVHLIYQERSASRAMAARREHAIRRLPAAAKRALGGEPGTAAGPLRPGES
ncbi:MAG: hypothetical protein B7Z66_03300 [Chromatiales bacterium 21-64-14]|nr:MAG: hypothetical protein B7Z66_03300 [Chromatiales bacterium 21-64-14]HQU15835.1 GIY-YIG nuclease family protein [Gammaproteobacteria bacterium]